MNNQTIIIGIGLAGRNIVRYLVGIIPTEEMDCLVLDTDAADLKEIKDSKNIRTMLLGEPVCKGVGTQADVKKGEEAAVSHKSDIMDALKGYRKAAIVFGAGGGTGSGAGPEVYKIAREMGIETSVILTKPFSFEAKTRLGNTEECLDALLHENAEMIVFENEELRSLKNKDISLAAAFDVIHAKIAEHIKAFVSSMGCLQRVCKSH